MLKCAETNGDFFKTASCLSKTIQKMANNKIEILSEFLSGKMLMSAVLNLSLARQYYTSIFPGKTKAKHLSHCSVYF